jgi:NADH-quinone oxidoreductase subunit A
LGTGGEQLLESFGFVGLFVIIAIGFAGVMIILPIVFRFLKVVPHHPDPVKTATFECGMQTIGKTWVQFNVRYYFYALVFVALDVLVVFLYPWATQLRRLGYSGLVVLLVFIGIILVGYLYAWKKRVLEWK